MKTIKALILTTISLLIFTTSAQACSGDDAHLILEIGNKTILEDEAAGEVFEHYPASPIPHLSKNNKKGIKLSSLIPDSFKSGKVIVYSCGRQLVKSFADLRSSNPELSNYYISLTKKKSLKLIHAKDKDKKGRAALKRLTRIQVLPDS